MIAKKKFEFRIKVFEKDYGIRFIGDLKNPRDSYPHKWLCKNMHNFTASIHQLQARNFSCPHCRENLEDNKYNMFLKKKIETIKTEIDSSTTTDEIFEMFKEIWLNIKKIEYKFEINHLIKICVITFELEKDPGDRIIEILRKLKIDKNSYVISVITLAELCPNRWFSNLSMIRNKKLEVEPSSKMGLNGMIILNFLHNTANETQTFSKWYERYESKLQKYFQSWNKALCIEILKFLEGKWLIDVNRFPSSDGIMSVKLSEGGLEFIKNVEESLNIKVNES